MNPRTPEPSNPVVIAGYPTRTLGLEFGGTHVELLVVERLEDYVDAEVLLRDPEAPEPPYWAHLWTGSRALARLVATEIECAGRRVIEIGCGVGLAGIVAALRGATVTLVDTVHSAVRFAQANAVLNGCRVTAVQADVRRFGVRGQFDLCFAADVTYDPALQIAVADFLAAHLAVGGRAWCAESVRTLDRGLRDACAQHGLHVSEREVREPEEGREAFVRLTDVRRR